MSRVKGEGLKLQHTPGPWKLAVYDRGMGRKSYGVLNADDSLLIESMLFEDAALIAAAPELLEACKWYEMACSDISQGQSKGYFEKAMRLGRLAIHKAEGRP